MNNLRYCYADAGAATIAQRRGSRSRELGKALEDRINMACEFYKSRDIAYIEKTPEPFTVTDRQYDKKGKFIGFTGHFEKRAQPDFKGTLRGGQSIVFEAKATENDRIMESAVTPWQKDSLDLHWNLGAKTFVVVSFGIHNFYRVPWSIWTTMKSHFGHQFMTAEDLERYRIPNGNTGLVLFLKGT